jgi:pyruvate formate lyase activating enzyme
MGQEITVAEAFKTVMKDKDFYESTNGGVTISGGEPLAQPGFVAALCEKLQASGIHTCLETSGYAEKKSLEKVLPHISLVYFDLKHMDSKEHKRVIGVPNESIHENLDYIAKSGADVVIRIPYIPGFNDSDDNMESTARFVAGIIPGAEVHLLPYHNYAVGKYNSLDRPYPMGNLEKPSIEQVEYSKLIFEKFNLNCTVKV